MFYDRARIYVKGGDGGNGASAFRREKYVPLGGPSGGDGGRGGNVILVADEGLGTLVDFRYKRHYKAERGEHGMGKNMHGRGAEDLVLRVPVGTVVKNSETGEILADLVAHGQRVVVAKGGRGGRGNARFATSQNKAPSMAEKGEPGQELWLELELKLLAHVGLVGFPNAGKSTLIAKVSAARPKIADYPFTTLVPNLGVVAVEEGRSFVMADIPGLIEGAHQGAGLGHEFLRHVERCRVLVHVVDMAGAEGRDPLEDYDAILRELELYKPALLQRPRVIAANKMDIAGAEENLARLRDKIGEQYEIYPVSAAIGQGVRELLFRLAQLVEEHKEEPVELTEEIRVVTGPEQERFTISRDDDGTFVVSGKEVERHLAMTNFENEEALKRFQNILRKMGVEDALKEHGAKTGDEVRIKDMIFDYEE